MGFVLLIWMIDFTWTAQSRQLIQAALGGRDRNMAHLLRGLSAALHANQFVAAPERAIKEQHVGGVEFPQERVVDLRDGGHIGEPLARRRFDDQAQGRFAEGKFALASGRNVCGIVRAERESAAAQAGVFARGIFQREDCSRNKRAPGHLTRNALQHGEHGIVFRQNAAD